MRDVLGLSVGDLVSMLKRKDARLPSEIGAFIALEACEAVLSGPALLTADNVYLAADGTVSVFAPPNSASGDEAARSVTALLTSLLVVAGPGVPPALLRIVERGTMGDRTGLSALRDELEASLIPINRAASRRVISRLIRETRREPTPAPLHDSIHGRSGDLDAALDSLLAGEEEPKTPFALRATQLPSSNEAQSPRRRDETTGRSLAKYVTSADDSGVLQHEVPPTQPGIPPLSSVIVDTSDTLHEANPPHLAPSHGDENVATLAWEPAPPTQHDGSLSHDPYPTPPVEPRRKKAPDFDSFTDSIIERKPRRLSASMIIGIGLILGLIAFVVFIRPDVLARLRGKKGPQELEQEHAAEQAREETAAAKTKALEEHRRRFGELVVHAMPERAQVLLYVGRGPAVAKNLPIGVAHEFIAIADGRTPTRAVIPANAPWTEENGERRYELAMQTGDQPMPPDRLELSATRLPRDVGEPTERLGSVRVITTPPGAKVYQLIGFSPEVRVSDIRTDEGHELLVYLEGHKPARLVVGPSDWRLTPDGPLAEMQVTLEER